MGRDAVDPRALYLEQLKLIDHIARLLCRRHGIRGADADDFLSEARLKLLQDDCAVLRKHRGESGMAGYLSAVLSNLLQDYRDRMWGKWRPSVRARELGETAILLETAIYRDGLSFDAACEHLRQNHGVKESRAELRRILRQLPERTRRRVEDERSLADLPAPETADRPVLERERHEMWETARAALRRLLAELPDEDQVILRMHYFDGYSIADVARAHDLRQRPLYDRLQRLYRTLAAALEREGVRMEELRDRGGDAA
jgi:RNA polymerase sigma factor (sigma-70 family)